MLLNLEKEYARPSLNHLFGFAENGTDLLSQICWGIRISLAISFVVVIFNLFVGLFLGTITAYYRGSLDLIFMRIVDILDAFPGILLIVALAALLGPSVENVVFALLFGTWSSFVRLVRASVLSLRERDFIFAARAIGCKDWQIIVFHIWPSVFPLLLTKVVLSFASYMLIEASLGFLGLGVPYGSPSLGGLLYQGSQVMSEAPHVLFISSAILILYLFIFNFAAEFLKSSFEVKIK